MHTTQACPVQGGVPKIVVQDIKSERPKDIVILLFITQRSHR